MSSHTRACLLLLGRELVVPDPVNTGGDAKPTVGIMSCHVFFSSSRDGKEAGFYDVLDILTWLPLSVDMSVIRSGTNR